MMSPSVSPVARNVGVSPPPDGNSAVGPFEGSSVQQDPDSRGRRADQLPRYFLGDQHEGSPYQIWGTPDPRRAGCVNRRSTAGCANVMAVWISSDSSTKPYIMQRVRKIKNNKKPGKK
uniref:Uncharacterized protein n=1 Tax=Zea mays TaxID=4577 RepID=A0A804PF28_MAIZE